MPRRRKEMNKDTAQIVNGAVTKEKLKVGDRHPTEYTTNRGLKLKLRAVPTVTIWEAQGRVKEPPVPTFYDPDVERDRPNPLDPEYKAALNNAAIERAKVGQYIRLGLGTELLTSPEEIAKLGMDSPDDMGWSQILEMAGLEIAPTGLARYVDWLRLYALGDEDQAALIEAIERAGALVTEDEVAAAEDSFRDNTIREVTKDVPSS